MCQSVKRCAVILLAFYLLPVTDNNVRTCLSPRTAPLVQSALSLPSVWECVRGPSSSPPCGNTSHRPHSQPSAWKQLSMKETQRALLCWTTAVSSPDSRSATQLQHQSQRSGSETTDIFGGQLDGLHSEDRNADILADTAHEDSAFSHLVSVPTTWTFSRSQPGREMHVIVENGRSTSTVPLAYSALVPSPQLDARTSDKVADNDGSSGPPTR